MTTYFSRLASGHGGQIAAAPRTAVLSPSGPMAPTHGELPADVHDELTTLIEPPEQRLDPVAQSSGVEFSGRTARIDRADSSAPPQPSTSQRAFDTHVAERIITREVTVVMGSDPEPSTQRSGGPPGRDAPDSRASVTVSGLPPSPVAAHGTPPVSTLRQPAAADTSFHQDNTSEIAPPGPAAALRGRFAEVQTFVPVEALHPRVPQPMRTVTSVGRAGPELPAADSRAPPLRTATPSTRTDSPRPAHAPVAAAPRRGGDVQVSIGRIELQVTAPAAPPAAPATPRNERVTSAGTPPSSAFNSHRHYLRGR